MSAESAPDRFLRELADRLSGLETGDEPVPEGAARAAVAMIFAGTGPESNVLLMRRVERAGDRWSGQISLPGGREEPEDADLLATAVRETREEVHLDLARSAEPLGRLPHLQARARGAFVPLWITPFVFLLREPVEPVPGPEAVETFWFPLQRAFSGAFDDVHRIEVEGRPLDLPAWRYEDRVVWGLTHRMLSSLS